MTRAFEKADETVRTQLQQAMKMPIETEEEKNAKIATVIEIYDRLGVGEEAKSEIIRLNSQALAYAAALNLQPEAYELLENYSKKLIGRNK